MQKKSGIYAYVLDGDEHHLGIRAFDDNTKREVYERQNGICNISVTDCIDEGDAVVFYIMTDNLFRYKNRMV